MNKKYSYLIISLAVILVLVVLGAWFFTISEGWSKTDSLYFVVMTITTVGYGDFVPTHDVSKVVTAIYSMISIPIVLFVFGTLAENYFERRMTSLERRLRSILAEEKEIEEAIDETEEKVSHIAREDSK